MIPEWLRKPETIYATVLFLISVGVGLYPSEIKGMMKIPGKRIQSVALRRLEGELWVITSLNENGYRLLLWALWHIVDSLKKIFQLVVITSGFNLIVGLISGHPIWPNPISPGLLLPPTVGVLAGHWRVASRILNGLLRFDARKAELDKEIAARKPPPPVPPL